MFISISFSDNNYLISKDIIMQVIHAQTIEIVKYKNKTFLCQIKVVPRAIKYFHGQKDTIFTHRWMEPEHWADFDSRLEQILNRFDSDEKISFCAESEKYELNALARLSIRTAQTPIKALCRCVGKDKLELTENNVDFAFECVINYKSDERFYTCKDNEVIKTTSRKHCRAANKSQDEFIQPTVSPKKDLDKNKKSGHEILEYEPQAVDATAPYVPYTPSAIGTNISLDVLEAESEPYVLDSSSGLRIHSSPESAFYKATPIKKKTIKLVDAIAIKPMETIPEKLVHVVQDKNKVKKSTQERRVTEENDSDRDFFQSKAKMKLRKSKNVAKAGAEAKENNCEHDSDTNFVKKCDVTRLKSPVPERNKNKVDSAMLHGHRSPRYCFKTKRYCDQKINMPCALEVYSSKGRYLNEELFGTDDDDIVADGGFVDEDAVEQAQFVAGTPKIYSSHRLLEIESKSKRKRELPSDCMQEKRTIGRWLGKECGTTEIYKKQCKSSVHNTASNSAGDTVCHTSKSSGQARVSDQMENTTAESKSLLDGTSPKKVDTLSLDKINATEILNSFDKYKSKLDKIFYQLRHRGHINTHKGINHCFVINFVHHDIQLRMMNKLREAYDKKNQTGTSSSTSLFANAMLPEWIICIFMDEHNLTREEAIKQIKAQEDYRFYLEAKLELPF